MTEQLPGMESERRKPELSQWFTPPETAMRIVEWAVEAFPHRDISVLEPSAGKGALINQFHRHVHIRFAQCVDIDADNVRSLERQGHDVWHADFLQWKPAHGFDLAIMNPPFEGGQAEAHILRALESCTRVVAHVPLTTLEGRKRREGLWSDAYLKRLAICSSRPKYGEKSGATAMCTIDVVRRPEGKHRGRVAASGVEVEWWP